MEPASNESCGKPKKPASERKDSKTDFRSEEKPTGKKRPEKYEELLKVDMDFGEFLQRIVWVRHREKEKDKNGAKRQADLRFHSIAPSRGHFAELQ